MTRTEQLLLQCRAMQVMWTPDIEKLIELMRLQHEALIGESMTQNHHSDEMIAALEAFNKWEGGE